ncbi:MAG TPA: hypothetical protein VGH91_13735 [Gammaproteobacteria bacterium]|jgi:hypothetical protein
MATYTSSQVSSGQIPINERGASFLVFGSIALTTALAANDIVQLVTVPNGYKVLNVTLDVDPLDSNASPTLTGTVGDPTTAGKYITVTAAQLKTGVVQPNNVTGSTGVVYAPASSGGNAGGTLIQFKATANPATWVNGTMRLAAELQIDNASFA